MGVSGRAMLRALVAGSATPRRWPSWPGGGCGASCPRCARRWRAASRAHHALLVGEILAQLDYLEEAIGRLSAEIERVIAPFAAAGGAAGHHPRRRSCAWPRSLIAEIGADMSRFGTPARLASWAGLCPGQHESAGKQRRGTTRKGSKWLRTHLTQAAKAAARTKGTYLAAQYARLRGRRGASKATIAVAHSILVAAFHILDRNVPYQDLGGDWFSRRRSPHQRARRLVVELNALGFDVQLQERAAA